MFKTSVMALKAKSLHEMFRLLKLRGAHPDVLYAIDARKAQHNGTEMINLETLLHQRSTPGGLKPNEPAETTFTFWLKPPSAGSAAGLSVTDSHSLIRASCTLTPRSPTRVVKQQLQKLFDAAGIRDEFELQDGDNGNGGVEMNLEKVLRDADLKQTQHVQQTGSLYLRGDRSIRRLRDFGILLVVEEDGVTYMVTLPEAGNGEQVSVATGQLDSETQEFLRERNLRPFDLRMAGSYSSVERFVASFERIESFYQQHRGLAMRAAVCIVLTLKGQGNYVAEDGAIVLSMQQYPSWEEYLLALPQAVWRDCVQKHKDWRLPPAPKLMERRRKLFKVADMFHFFGVSLEETIGAASSPAKTAGAADGGGASPSGLAWQEELIFRLSREEVSIRNAVKKYRLTSDLLKRRGFIHFHHHLFSRVDPSKEIGFRLTGDGKLYLNASLLTTPQILKVLKENLPTMEKLLKQYDHSVTQLEYMSRSLPLDFSVDSEWKAGEEANVGNCLDTFVATIKANQGQLALFLGRMLEDSTAAAVSHWQQGGASSSTAAAAGGVKKHKRLTWIVSNRFETMPSGVVFVPWDVDFESIKKLMLTGSR